MAATSLQVFRMHLSVCADGSIDASQIHSPACYRDWLDTRGRKNSDLECKKFQRSLSNHLAGVDGRSAFEPREEEAILKVLRKKECWPCFPARLKIGMLGFRSRGFHEKRRKAPEAIASPNANLNAFAQHIFSYSTAFECFGIDVSMSIFALLRQFFETQTPERLGKPRSELLDSAAYAQELCKKISQKHGGCAVTIYSYGDFAKRIVAQNAQSKHWFGDFTLANKEQPRLIQASDWGKLALALGQAFAAPGTNVPAQLTCDFADGSVHALDFIVYVDPQSHLNVGISKKQPRVN